MNCDEDIDECGFEVPICQNEGVCSNLPGAYECECQPGWEGMNCDVDIDECLDAPCVHGACENTLGSYVCMCDDGWEGVNCELDVDECSLGICENFATCENSEGSYTCTCQAGTTGSNCEQAEEQCSAGVCGMNAVDCVDYEPALVKEGCPSSDTCNDEVCRDAVCLLDDWCCTSWDSLCASCATEGVGFDGMDCTGALDACAMEFAGVYECTCDQGWTGAVCDEDVNECLSFPCENGGACENNPGSYTCDCPAGWTGMNCLEPAAECEEAGVCGVGKVCEDLAPEIVSGCPNGDGCSDTVCRDAVCALDPFCCSDWDESCGNCGTYGVGYGGMDCSAAVGACAVSFGPGFQCACPEGWTGETCDVDINECLDDPCANGSCVNEPGSFSCECDGGWEGALCDQNINECLEPGICNHGACNDELADAGYAHCTTGTGCDVQVCRDAVAAKDNYCATGWDGSCADCAMGKVTAFADCTSISTECFDPGQPGSSCTCMDGWVGDDCAENVNECLAGALCENGGACVDVEPDSSAWLSCQEPQSDGAGGLLAGCAASDECTSAVCAEDPYCCDTAWDAECIALAESDAGLSCSSEAVCGDGFCAFNEDGSWCPEDCGELAQDCCSDVGGVSCSDDFIAQCVCDADAYCCETAWDATCAELVDELGCGYCAVPPAG